MKSILRIRHYVIVILLFLVTIITAQEKKNDPTIIKLTQTSGKFESEDLKLKPGNYQFEIYNNDIESEVAFVLRKETDRESMEMSTALPNSLLDKPLNNGESGTTGIVKLESGEYVYGCPLNGTPIYTITVE